eukprot:7010569-Alexandrium_andersonii.AAC.1
MPWFGFKSGCRSQATQCLPADSPQFGFASAVVARCCCAVWSRRQGVNAGITFPALLPGPSTLQH